MIDDIHEGINRIVCDVEILRKDQSRIEGCLGLFHLLCRRTDSLLDLLQFGADSQGFLNGPVHRERPGSNTYRSRG